MIDLEDLYFEWLLSCVDPDGVTEGVTYVCGLLHDCEFLRRVGNDLNRAVDGVNLRKEFLTQFEEVNFGPNVTNDLMGYECSWFEMLIALARRLDYLYEGGIEGRLLEMIDNMELGYLTIFDSHRSKMMKTYDQQLVSTTTGNIDNNRFTRDGYGGIFPLHKRGHADQRKVEIWEQHAAYFRERFEGVTWTSTK